MERGFRGALGCSEIRLCIFIQSKKKKKKLPKSGPGNPGEGRGGRATTEPACSGDLRAGTVCPPSLEARAPRLLPVGLTTRMQRFQASR